jgi:hypothetical protein
MRENSEMGTVRHFQSTLATYLKYLEEFRHDPGIMTVSFLCMTEGPKREVAEITGLVVT